MKQSVRRVLFLIFLLAFCILAPFTVLYTAGYRFSFQSGIDLDAGSLSITSNPSRAEIVLQDTRMKDKTPHVFQELHAGRYRVQVNKEGFFPWLGVVQITPGFTTYLQQTYLFRKSEPIRVTDQLYPDSKVAIQDHNIAYTARYIKDSGPIFLYITHAKENNPIEVASFIKKPEQLQWSANGSYLFIMTSDTIYLYTKQGKEIMVQEVDQMPTAVFWDIKNDSTLYIALEDKVLLYDFSVNEEPIVLPTQTIQRIDRSLFVMKDDFASSILQVEQGSETRELARLPRSHYTFVNTNRATLVLTDTQGDFYFIDALTGDVRAIPAHAIWHESDKTSQELVFANHAEIQILTSEQQELVLRLADGFTDVHKHPSGERILFSTSTTLEAIDTYAYARERDRITLATFDNIQSFFIDHKGKTAYIFGTKDGITAIYRLQLH